MYTCKPVEYAKATFLRYLYETYMYNFTCLYIHDYTDTTTIDGHIHVETHRHAVGNFLKHVPMPFYGL